MSAEREEIHDSDSDPIQDHDQGDHPENINHAKDSDAEPSEDVGADAGESESEALRGELQQTIQNLTRLHADFANYRKRMQSEQARWEARAIVGFVREILPVLDNLERALAAIDDTGQAETAAWKEGVTLVARQFQEILTRQGVEVIETEGQPFDPRVHEAMVQVETNQVPENHVVAEFQRGYRHGDEIIRPSLVSVAKPFPSEDEQNR